MRRCSPLSVVARLMASEQRELVTAALADAGAMTTGRWRRDSQAALAGAAAGTSAGRSLSRDPERARDFGDTCYAAMVVFLKYSGKCLPANLVCAWPEWTDTCVLGDIRLLSKSVFFQQKRFHASLTHQLSHALIGGQARLRGLCATVSFKQPQEPPPLNTRNAGLPSLAISWSESLQRVLSVWWG